MPTSYFIIRSLLFSITLLLLACGQSSTGQEHRESSKIAAVAEKDSQLDYNGRAPGHLLYHKPEWPLEIRKEIYGDPEIFSTPRIQFRAKISGDKLFKRENRYSLWSMKLDGSDKRLVAEADLLNLEGGGLAHTPIRSPDNRYVALSLSNHKHDYFIAILDLKTKQKTVISEGGGPPNFNWTQDSQNLIYYANRNHYNYNIPDAKLTNREIIYSSALFLLPGDKQFLGFEGNGYSIYQFNGKRLKQFEYDFEIAAGSHYPSVSPSGKYLLFKNGAQAYLANIQTGKLVESFNSNVKRFTGAKPFFGVDDYYVHLYGAYKFSTFSLKELKQVVSNKKLEEPVIWSMSDHSSYTIFNR